MKDIKTKTGQQNITLHREGIQYTYTITMNWTAS